MNWSESQPSLEFGNLADSYDQPVSNLSLLREAERQKLLVEWNDTETDYPNSLCIHQLFEAQVEQTPDAIALIFEQQQLTYKELDQQTNQLAHYLRDVGVKPEMLVGICTERSLEMVVGLLGILKAGGVYVPLDPSYPNERITFMLQDAQPIVLLTQQRLIPGLPAHPQMICLDTDWQVIAQESEEALPNNVNNENLAYMLYTSGSTGRPKGVLGTHKAAINRFQWTWNTYPFKSEEVCCQKTSLSFVDSVWEIFGPLLQGIRAVIIPDTVVKNPQKLLQILAAHTVTRIVLVPSLLDVLLDTMADQQILLPYLKYWVSSGEALPIDLTLRFLKSMPDSVLLNLYGSSEVAADVLYYDTRNYSTSLPGIPIGRPIANTQIYLLDEQMRLVPIGEAGELHVGGDGLARGYFNRQELTAAKFVPNPFSHKPGARLYKTGDWARYLPDGNIEYLGRLDHQVKIRGNRIELGEIESTLSAHPAIHQAVVLAREDEPGDPRLVAYVVLHDKQITMEELQNYLSNHLPQYMLPSAFVSLDTMPLTPNGKLNRHALSAPQQAHANLQSNSEEARSPLEEKIAAIWSQVLQIKQIGIHDNFFSLGGHSLLAMQILSRLQATFQMEIPLQKFLEAPTVAQLGELLQNGQIDSMKSHKPSLRSISRDAYRLPSSRES